MNPALKLFLDSEGCYFREDASIVDEALSRIGVAPPRSFVDFYRSYEGAFGSDYTGFVLQDIVRGNEGSIVRRTEICRQVHGFQPQHLVISDVCGEAILVFDSIKDGVYNVDFEGSDELLKKGALKPQWNSFEEFLNAYFLGEGWPDVEVGH